MPAAGRSRCRSALQDTGEFEVPGHFDEAFGAEHMLINIGPQHPATHGVLRLVLELDGETVVRCIPHIGYLHSRLREARRVPALQPDHPADRPHRLPVADGEQRRLALAAEKLMGIEITERCTVLRVIACELSRIISHLVWLGTTGIDIGAFTPFLWAFQERERIYNLQEAWTGARLTTSAHAGRRHDGRHPRRLVEAGCATSCRTFPKTLDEIDAMLTRNAHLGAGARRASA